jgi:ATP-dependent Clp protease ATP-binding subunit ClpA
VFERFTERARKAIVLAQDEARHFNHNYVGTEHLLLGLLREDEGVAAQALYSLNVDLDKAREQVESIVGFGEEGTGVQAPFTLRTKKVFEYALRESLQLGHNYISTEHLLLGLLRESEGVAARVFSNLDVDPDKVRREVIKRLGGGRSRNRGGVAEDVQQIVDREIAAVRSAKEAALDNKEFEDAARFRDCERKLMAQRRELGEAGRERPKKSPVDNLSLFLEVKQLQKEVRALSRQVRKLKEQGAS